MRRGAFRPRAVVELRLDAAAATTAIVNVLVAGRPVPAEVRLVYREPAFAGRSRREREPDPGDLRSAHVELPPPGVRELKVWAHQMVPEGFSDYLPARVDIACGATVQQRDLGRTADHAVVPLDGAACPVQVRITLATPSA